MTISVVLNVVGLFVGVVAACLMYYFPPRVTLYTEKGEPHVTWLSKETDEGKRRGKYQKWLSKAAPWILAASFLLQMVAVLLTG